MHTVHVCWCVRESAYVLLTSVKVLHACSKQRMCVCVWGGED